MGYAGIGFGLLALVLPALGLVVGDSRATAIAILGIGGLTAVLTIVGAIVSGYVVPRRRYGADAELARRVGARHPAVASDLLSAVELDQTAVRERAAAPSSELVDALISSTEHRLAGIDPASVVPARELRRVIRIAIAVGVVHLVALIAMPVGRGWRHLIAPTPTPFGGAHLSV
ncbi:MAG: hypothetical protein H0T79_07010, partial [Deltaproteobacteria bacterium]|nr:hypothetical protein [Deltaproteobacteria bacterium]